MRPAWRICARSFDVPVNCPTRGQAYPDTNAWLIGSAMAFATKRSMLV